MGLNQNSKESRQQFFNTHYAFIEAERQKPGFSWNTINATLGNPYASGERLRCSYKDWRFRQGKQVEAQQHSVVPPYDTSEPFCKTFTTTTTDSSFSELGTVSEQAKSDKFVFIKGEENRDKGTKVFSFTADHIPTEEEIVKHFHIDLKKWRINQIYHKTSFAGRYAVTVSQKEKSIEEQVDYSKAFLDFLDKYEGRVKPSINSSITEDEEGVYSSGKATSYNGMLLISLADLHIGNVQVENYADKIKDTVKTIIQSSVGSCLEEIVVLNSGDLIHCDNSKNTTHRGTQLDPVLTYEQAFTDALDLLVEILEYGASVAPKIKLINLRGNHSHDTEYILGESLKRIFKTTPNVEVINNKEYRTYYRYGNSSFLFSHGDKGSDRLPLVFATEGKHVFGVTDNHYVFTAHLHHSSSKQFVNDRKEYAGIEVRVLASPTSTDRYHSDEAYVMNTKQMLAFLFEKDEGKVVEFTYKIK